MTVLRIQGLQSRQQSLEFSLDALQPVGAMPRIQSAGFAESNSPAMVQAKFQAFHNGRGAPADRQRHRLGERKSTQTPTHGPRAPIHKLAQHRRIRH